MKLIPPQVLENFSRRNFLRGIAQLPLLALGLSALPGCEFLGNLGPPDGSNIGLGALARLKGRTYGAAVQSWQLDESTFANAVRHEAAMIVPETELKWNVLRPAPDRFDFTGYNKLADFATANNIRMRGHVLLWHDANPAWLAHALERRDKAERILEQHIYRVIGETSGVIRNWDVVNEAVHPHSTRSDYLRQTLWLKALGPDYVATAFRIAHHADAGLTLVYNDYGTERGDGDGNRKRQGILRLLEKCKIEKVPIHAFGLQSHLRADRPLANHDFKVFLKEVRSLGLKVYITELDLDVSRLSGRMDDRVRVAQNYVRTYLKLVQESGAIDMLLTWGLSDRYSWLNETHPNLKGILPLDDDMMHGPLWDTLALDWLGFDL